MDFNVSREADTETRSVFVRRTVYRNGSTAAKISTGTPASRGPSATAGLLVGIYTPYISMERLKLETSNFVWL